METELIALIDELAGTITLHPIETIRIDHIKHIIRLVSRAKVGIDLEAQLRERERAYDRETHARTVSTVKRW